MGKAVVSGLFLMGGAALLAGCASSAGWDHPFGLRGSNETMSVPAATGINAYTDDKLRYHPDWEAGINRPPNYPRPLVIHEDLRQTWGQEDNGYTPGEDVEPAVEPPATPKLNKPADPQTPDQPDTDDESDDTTGPID